MTINYFALFAFVRALFKGEIIFQPAKWKNRQLLSDALTALILAGFAVFPDYTMAHADVAIISSFIALVLSAIVTAITTRKIGLDPNGRFKNVYDKAKANTPDIDPYIIDNGMPFPIPNQAQSDDARMPLETEPNSVNSGGKGLRGGQ